MNTYLLKRARIDAEAGIEKAHFLNPRARRCNKSLGDLTGLTGFGFHLIEVKPGDWSTELHRHYYEDECVYMLAGVGTATIGDEQFAVAAGDFLAYPRGGPAPTIQNTGDELLRCIVVGERRSHDVGDYPNQNKRIYRNQGLPWNLVDIKDIETPEGGEKRS